MLRVPTALPLSIRLAPSIATNLMVGFSWPIAKVLSRTVDEGLGGARRWTKTDDWNWTDAPGRMWESLVIMRSLCGKS
ncbi:hypothetical protein HDK77DRAFT_455447 [Phyllosticta capitalensis]